MHGQIKSLIVITILFILSESKGKGGALDEKFDQK